MDIMQAATTLGQLIKESEVYKKLEAAKEAYENCAEIGGYMTEYEAQQKALENLAAQSEPDTQIIDSIQNRLNELFRLVTEHQLYVELSAAQSEVNELMEQVNNQITFTITGKLTTSCTHDCSTCHSGCHH